MWAKGGVPAPLWSNSALPEVALWTGPEHGRTGGVDAGGGRTRSKEYAGLRQEIRASPVVYGDETGWREDGRNGYLWSFSTPKVRCFLRRGGRGRQVAEEVVGDEFEGVLVSDCYGAYNVHQGLQQRCWTHLLRDIHQLKEQYPQHQGLAEWAGQVREVHDHAQAYPGPDPLPATVQRTQRVKQQPQYQKLLWAIGKPYLGSGAPMNVLCQRVERFLPELFTFAADPRMSADNNAAERSLRPTVVSRKISGGTRSPAGSGTKGVLASFLVRDLAPARPQPLPCPELHPLPTPTRPSLNSYPPPVRSS